MSDKNKQTNNRPGQTGQDEAFSKSIPSKPDDRTLHVSNTRAAPKNPDRPTDTGSNKDK